VAATPRGILVSLGVPGEWPEGQVAELMEGAAEAVTAVGGVVWGGDLVRSDRVMVDVAVVGEMDGEPVLRSGAAAGDGLWVTGMLGGPKAALDAWRDRREPEASARERFVKPAPRMAEAKWLREHGVKAMIDVSDGLVSDAGHLAAASSVQCVLDADRVPRHAAARELMDALVGGEEYELLVALPGSFDDARAREFSDRFRLPLTRVGSARDGAGVVVERKGKLIRVSDEFRHF
jgi:thiamine-monophosphate kinase